MVLGDCGFCGVTKNPDGECPSCLGELAGWEDASTEEDGDLPPGACPGCGGRPGEGYTQGCGECHATVCLLLGREIDDAEMLPLVGRLPARPAGRDEAEGWDYDHGDYPW